MQWRDAIDAEVFTVSVVEAAAPEGATVAGEKLHDAPAGNPELQISNTDELKLFTGVIDIVVVALCPAITVNDAGEAATVKSGRLTVYVALATALVV